MAEMQYYGLMWGRYPLVFFSLPCIFHHKSGNGGAAQTFGAEPKSIFSISLPMIIPAIVNAVYMAFLMALQIWGLR